jgi:glycosyltransferase involved in cell wall biosynthesis
MHHSLSIVVPVYNSEASLPLLVERLEAVLPAFCSAYEVILVNDGSKDRSWDVIETLAARVTWVRGINLMRNYGQHNALLCGIRSAQNEIVVTMDDDLQNPPEEIPKLLRKLDDGFDMVYGTPSREQHGLLRDLASQVTKRALQSAMGAETARNVSAFRAFRTYVRNAFATYQSPNVNLDVLLTWGTGRFAAVPVRHEPRQIGASNYTLAKLMVHALNMMTGFSTAPLRLASLIGFGFTLFGLLILAYVLVRFMLEGSTVAGFPFLASIIAIFSGAQMFALGIIGEYLARMHTRTMERPPYTVRDLAEHAPGQGLVLTQGPEAVSLLQNRVVENGSVALRPGARHEELERLTGDVDARG